MFGLWAETRPHEVGITSNRESSRLGEYVPKSCTHRPSHAGSKFGLKFNLLVILEIKLILFLSSAEVRLDHYKFIIWMKS